MISLVVHPAHKFDHIASAIAFGKAMTDIF